MFWTQLHSFASNFSLQIQDSLPSPPPALDLPEWSTLNDSLVSGQNPLVWQNRLFGRLPCNSAGRCALVTLLLPISVVRVTRDDLAVAPEHMKDAVGLLHRSRSSKPTWLGADDPTDIDAIGLPDGVPDEYKLADQMQRQLSPQRLGSRCHDPSRRRKDPNAGGHGRRRGNSGKSFINPRSGIGQAVRYSSGNQDVGRRGQVSGQAGVGTRENDQSRQEYQGSQAYGVGRRTSGDRYTRVDDQGYGSDETGHEPQRSGSGPVVPLDLYTPGPISTHEAQVCAFQLAQPRGHPRSPGWSSKDHDSQRAE
ncbi:uncharacterized protein LOC133509387 [Syngnathoides biaculeatus]|uniref:uncharacterized protein LOC133509387 n=1 Tax=Syngnathoides biaculeatus TaxID=300417 RepID=UPI002ADD7945|nr:uncharacterized protein LOC133509387 [Syngnathoides biaculeatus]XP_061692273.1 uncharacterized protein LOC133509387 [Syngnathoides biaculeatus]XP_061692275.1 uncharacterized protein LOC133509387 [Syngnathoides biaculeatus]XP_061692276.1 uncharacterized protein LOC133509387 [Syngnathoides biaculeatus]XP_061692277.1 uncharacterized protein LOC133509387 [Syngnathoides biaculeatus]